MDRLNKPAGMQVTRRDILQHWLSARGFHQNPFASREAEAERSLLGAYFVEPDYFDEIREEPKTVFLFAPRGSGKTACRIMIEEYCHNSFSTDQRILAVPHTHLSSVLDRAGDVTAVTVRHHAEEILQQAVVALTNELEHRTMLVDEIRSLEWANHWLLQWYYFGYGAYLTPRQIDFLRIKANFRTQTVDYSLPEEPLRLIPQIEEEPGTLSQIPLEVVALLEQRQGISSVQLLKDFAGLLSLLQIHTIYVLVDGVDEMAGTAASPAAAIRLLEPLVSNLELMNMPGVAYKLFLPAELRLAVEMHPAIRTDRLVLREVQWDEKRLREMLRSRLEAYNDQGISDVGGLCTLNMREWVDDEIVHLARGSPRNMLRLGELLLSEHCKTSSDIAEGLNEQDWEAAVARFEEDLALDEYRRRWIRNAVRGWIREVGGIPGLEEQDVAKAPVYEEERGLRLDKVTGEVFIDGQRLEPPLGGQEFKLLRYLYQRRGEICSKDDIAIALWGKEEGYEIGDARIDQIVYRLRRRIEPAGADNPRFLITHRGRGYRLLNTVE